MRRRPRARGLRSTRELLALLPDTVLIVDGTGTLLWANAAATHHFGLEPAAYAGTPALDLIHPDDREMAVLSLTSVVDKSVGTPLELRIAAVEGWRLVEVVGAPLPPDVALDEAWSGPSNGDGLILLTIRDLTQRRRWEVAHDRDELFRSLVQYGASLTLLVSADHRIVTISGAVSRLLGLDPEQLEGRPLTDLVDETDGEELARALERVGQPSDADRRVSVNVALRTGRGGPSVPHQLTIVNLLDDPTVEGLVVTGHDISRQHEAETELHAAVSLLNATLDSTADGILVVDLEGNVTNFNSRLMQMWRLPPHLLGASDSRLAFEWVSDQLVDPEAFAAKVHAIETDASMGESFDVIEFKDGRVFERSTRALCDGDTVVGRVACFRDVTEQARLRAELEHQAFHDSLTGLANQALFRDRVGHAIARSSRVPGQVGVLFLDLDRFKKVNDSLGHPAGDLLLVEMTACLLRCLREADTAARLGGDEFAVLLEDIGNPDEAIEVADRILTSLREPFDVDGSEVFASVSIGIAFHRPGLDTDQLLRNADLAMYSAKRRGRGRHELYVAEMHEIAVQRLTFESELRRGIERRELVVWFQPILDAVTEKVVSVEALVRWRHPTRGLLGPDTFIELAEESGVIAEIGAQVLIEACHQTRAWQQLDGLAELSVAVNLSPHQLSEPSVVDLVTAALDASGLAPEHLVLELTETAIMQEERAIDTLRQLSELGVRLAVDDFGTGYSSLTYVQRFPIDILKIDRSFVSSMPEQTQLIEAIVLMARTMELTVVAEGVETAEQLAELRRLGCPLVQGYHFARPLDPDGFEYFASTRVASPATPA